MACGLYRSSPLKSREKLGKSLSYLGLGKSRLIDAATGERLLSSSEVETAQQAAEERAAREAEARQAAEEARQTAEERAAVAEERAARETEPGGRRKRSWRCCAKS